MTAAVIIPTRNAGPAWEELCCALYLQKPRFQILVIDSQSIDETVVISGRYNLHVRSIRLSDFNHGATRAQAVTWCRQEWGVQSVVLMTQDALPESPESIHRLLAALEEPGVVAAYGRHMARPDADWFEQGLREFNYPPVSRTVRWQDISHLGRRAAFCSNTFAAYNVEALQAAGGFPSHLILGEDSWAAMALLRHGGAIRYVADARVWHSHDYTPVQLAKRYFDTGVFHAQADAEFRDFGSVRAAGNSYVRFQLERAGWSPRRWVDATVRLSLSALFYGLGKRYQYLPRALCRRLSMHRGFW